MNLKIILKNISQIKTKEISPTQIYSTLPINTTLDDNSKPKDGFFDDRLFDGDFSPLQAQRFFSRYDLFIHQPNTESGFSATLFQNKESKEFTLAIISTESKCDGIK